MNTITKLSNNPNIINERNEFRKLKNNIDKKGFELKKKIDINYYEYINYIGFNTITTISYLKASNKLFLKNYVKL